MVDAVYADFAAHHFNKLLGYVKAEPGPFYVAVVRLVHTLEGTEEVVQAFLADAHAGVLYGDAKENLVCGDTLPFCGKGNGAGRRVFDCIGQHIGDHLLDPYFIPVKHGWNFRVNVNFEFQIFLVRADPDQIDQIAEHGTDLVLGWHDIHFAGFQLGEIEDVVYRGEKHFAGILDVDGILRNFVGDVLPEDHFV